MFKFTLFTFLLFVCQSFINSNLWDNIFSQIKSPQLVLPEESKVELFNNENKMMEVVLSTSMNAIKISLLDKHLINTFANFTKAKDFLNIFVNFTSGTVDFDWEDNCSYLNVSLINKFRLKFFLASYDLLTFFNEAEQYYEYYFTNPLHSSAVKDHQLKFLENTKDLKLDSGTNDLEFNNKIEKNINQKIKFFNRFFSIQSLLDNEAKIVFKVDKKTKTLEKVFLNYSKINLELKAKSSIYKSEGQNDFIIRNNCTLLKINSE